MSLAEHIRPLLRDHDCVIIPEFGGLVAEPAPARLEPGRQGVRPPSKWVAFNQALTRNDGLLVDAVAHAEHLTIAEARQQVRAAVAQLQASLETAQRAELPGIGVFRRVAGRGLSFEYTGTDNLLPAAFGLPTLPVRAVRAIDARAAREQLPLPALRGGRRSRLNRALPGVAVGLLAVALVGVNLFLGLRSGALPLAWQQQLASYGWVKQATSVAKTAAPAAGTAPQSQAQQANLAQQAWTDNGVAEAAPAPAVLASSEAPTVPTRTPEFGIAPTATAGPTTPVSVTAPARITSSDAALKKSKAPVDEADKPADFAKASAAVVPTATDEPATATPKVTAAIAPVGPGYVTTIKGRTGRFYIMGGAFTTLTTALAQRQGLARLKHRARVLLPGYGETLYKVSIDDYPDRATADAEARRMRTQTRLGTGLWVLQR